MYVNSDNNNTIVHKQNDNQQSVSSSLFGTEDVDLRIPPIMGQIAQSIQPLSALSVTESAIVESKVGMDIINPALQRPKAIDDNSQDSNEKFNTILMQATEQVKNSDVNPDQIQTMVQQLMQAKQDSDARKMRKRTSTSNQSGNDDESNDVFSSDSGDDATKQSHRVPKRRRADDVKNGPSNAGTVNSNQNKSPSKEPPTASPPKERRVRKTKWNSPWEERTQPMIPMQTVATNILPNINFPPNVVQPPPLNSGVAGDADKSMRQFSSRQHNPQSVWQQNFTPMNATTMQVPAVAPMLGAMPPQLIMAQHGSNLAHSTTKERTINIDGIPREIRFYGETAIAFMDGTASREPKEIGFQSGDRRLCVDNNETIVLAFNDKYKPFIVNGNAYQIRLGSPTRELYIDNEWYECYFGDPAVGIVLNGKLHSFRVDGPAPQVRIGSMRNDLVVGKVDMYVDINTKVSLFLDAQEQIFQVNNNMHKIQFADYLKTVLIDNIPFAVEYGGMPAKYRLDNSDHYIRFSVLPSDIVAGKVFIRNMRRTTLHRDLISPPPPMGNSTNAILPPAVGPIVPLMSIVPNPDLIAGQAAPSNNEIKSNASDSNVIAPPESSKTSAAAAVPGALPMDINDLYQKLLATGILNTVKDTVKDTPKEKKPVEKATPISLSKPDTLKQRQTAIINTIYSGRQCSSCGLRFPLQQTTKYSQHLDWHYRHNRREKGSAQRVHSRKWYYEVADWIQYEEIENVDEREKNFFEAQQNDDDSEHEDSNQPVTGTPSPSCAAGPDDHDRACDMCHDKFETFFHEDTEEWHLRNAIRFEDKTFHPDCYDDYQVNIANE